MSIVCDVCNKILSYNEIGLTKKFNGHFSEKFYCIECLAKYHRVDKVYLEECIEFYKRQGCQLFE